MAAADRRLRLNSMFAERLNLARLVGTSHDGERDVFSAAGYPRTVTFAMYDERARKQDIAKRIVEAPVTDTWSQLPELVEGHDLQSASNDTDAATGWLQLEAGSTYDNLEELNRLNVWRSFLQADLESGIGRYAVLLAGFADGKELSEPLERGALGGAGGAGLLYLNVFDEGAAQIKEIEHSAQSPRFNLPTVYTLTYEDGSKIDAHWTRCIHLAEGHGDIYRGAPRLEAVYNRLLDIEKIMAAAGESAWLLINKGMILTAKEGYDFPDDTTERTEQIDEYLHGLRRLLELEGVDVENQGGEVVDPRPVVELNIALIAATMNMPQRILLGSERGELASSMDEVNWGRFITSRRYNHINADLLLPFVARLIYAGALPAPLPGNHLFFRWPDFSEPDGLGEARTAATAANALKTLGISVDPKIFVQVFLPSLPEDAVLGWWESPSSIPPTIQPTENRHGLDTLTTNGHRVLDPKQLRQWLDSYHGNATQENATWLRHLLAR